MAHEVMDWEGINRNSWIRFSDKKWKEICESIGVDPEFTSILDMTVLAKNKKSVMLTMTLNSVDVEDRDVGAEILREEYECTMLYTSDWEGADPDTLMPEDIWASCEKHYGINHHGSNDPDPRRQLAFAILRGDPVALDAATDVIRG